MYMYIYIHIHIYIYIYFGEGLRDGVVAVLLENVIVQRLAHPRVRVAEQLRGSLGVSANVSARIPMRNAVEGFGHPQDKWPAVSTWNVQDKAPCGMASPSAN